jgi:hypothetical protein
MFLCAENPPLFITLWDAIEFDRFLWIIVIQAIVVLAIVLIHHP